jgi:hypothetical protein
VLAGLAAAIALLLLAWSWKLGSPGAAHATIRGTRQVRIRRAGPLSGAVGAVAVKELRTWWRDPLRVQTIAVSLPWALGTCLLPLTFGSKALLPWAGPAMALTAITSSVNLYGQDGTALWLTLVIPGAERNDVHGRQRAFLFLFGPVVTIAAVTLTALAGPTWTWPWVLALTPALLGGGIGLLAWMSIAALAPGPDPHRRPDNPMENAGATGPAHVMFWVGLLACLPAVGMVLAGTLLQSAPLRWAGIPVGVAVGLLLYAWLGHAGYRRLEARGPELLLEMRAGRSSKQPRAAAATRAGASARGAATVQMPRKQGAIIGFGIPLGSILLLPQGIIPAVLKLAHGRERIWFLPLYLPKPLQWPACFVMITLGVAVYCYVLWTMRQLKKSSREPRAGKGGGRSLKSALTRIGAGQNLARSCPPARSPRSTDWTPAVAAAPNRTPSPSKPSAARSPKPESRRRAAREQACPSRVADAAGNVSRPLPGCTRSRPCVRRRHRRPLIGGIGRRVKGAAKPAAAPRSLVREPYGRPRWRPGCSTYRRISRVARPRSCHHR